MQRSCKTEGALAALTQDAVGALAGAAFEGAQAVEHSCVAGQQLCDGAVLGELLKHGTALDGWRHAEQLASSCVDHEVDAVFAEGDGGFEFASSVRGV
ncbi:MAG: hypothetical protein Q8R82_15325 [Hyphomonadaceae bacterium]|nr:hypothetical protein [Hyphomonadaceae bacterium]